MQNIGQLRQWLNENRIDDVHKMVNNEEIDAFLSTTTGTSYFRNPTKLETLIDNAVRDFTRIIPRSKKEVRRRIEEILKEYKDENNY
jgi:vacuolar-type H+-ATPase subunit C/Vma6